MLMLGRASLSQLAFEQQGVPLPRPDGARRATGIDSPCRKRFRHERQGSNGSAFLKVRAGENNGAGSNDCVATNLDVLNANLGEMAWHGRVGHRFPEIVVCRRIDGDILRQTGKGVQGNAAARVQEATAADVNVTSKTEAFAHRDNLREPVDPDIIANRNVLNPDNVAVASDANILANRLKTKTAKAIAFVVTCVERILHLQKIARRGEVSHQI